MLVVGGRTGRSKEDGFWMCVTSLLLWKVCSIWKLVVRRKDDSDITEELAGWKRRRMLVTYTEACYEDTV